MSAQAIDNEWGITMSDDVKETEAKGKNVEDSGANLDDLKNQLGGLFKKK